MRLITLTLLAFFTYTLAVPAQKEDIIALRREYGIMETEYRTFTKSMDEKMASLRALVEQLIQMSTKNAADLALLKQDLKNSLSEQQASVTQPVAGLGAKIDKLTNDVNFTRSAAEDLNSRMSKIQGKLDDLDNKVSILANPPAPPPPGVDGAGGALGATAPPVGVSSEDLFNAALRDKAASPDLAMQEFQQYLQYFPTGARACEAQFQMGEIYSAKSQFPEAASAYDKVLEQYPSTCTVRTDAQLMKAKSLADAGDRDAAMAEYRAILQANPTGAVAAKAKDGITKLGVGGTRGRRGGR